MNRTHSAIAVLILLLTGCASVPKFTVETEPVGADIFVDGVPVGKTPATITVKFAENAQLVIEKKILTVKLTGYQEKKEVISDKGNTKLKFLLSPDHVASAPSAAKVISRSSTTPGQADPAASKSEVSSGPSATSGQVIQAVIKADVVSQQSATTGL